LNSISHELRTPLAASTSAASALAAAETAPPEQRRALIGEIQEANARLNRVVGNLLDVARLESGQVRPRLDWHDARDLVQTTLRELQRELAAHPVKLDLPAAPLLVRLDFSLTQHALANLLLNAANHTPANTPIEVSAQLATADRASRPNGCPASSTNFSAPPPRPPAAADLDSPSSRDSSRRTAEPSPPATARAAA
jgi:two-component system sensor histidine kinase KdpD